MATENRARTDKHGHEHGPEHGHHHRDVSGGWLRPAVFGAMDGLVTNASLIAGVGGGGASAHTIVLTGLAGLAAGAGSMAAGEYVSVSSQNELIYAEVNKERLELENNAASEQAELATMLRARGVSAATARQAAAEISANPEKALAVHALEELGVDPGELPSPVVAAGASLASFAVGAIIPLIPYLAGLDRDGRLARPRRRRRDRRRGHGGPADRTGPSGGARSGRWSWGPAPSRSRT